MSSRAKGEGPVDFREAVDRIRQRDTRYQREAYAFVVDSLDFAIFTIGERRHVDAEELLANLCEYAKRRYGVLAYSVLFSWGVRATEDVGAIVYNLIDQRVFAAQEGDSPADFSGVFHLRKRLEEDYFERPVPGTRRNPRTG